ncbi:MAG: dipeptidase [Candidatus Zixiibacteriota bacterium]
MIIDGHLDLAYNVIAFRRNICHELEKLRQEDSANSPGTAGVCLPELRNADVRICFGTIFIAPMSPKADLSEYQVLYNTPKEAYEKGMAQLNYYHALANLDDCGQIHIIGNQADLKFVLENKKQPQLGIVPLMEGAEGIRTPSDVVHWHEKGLRIVGPAWADTQYAYCSWNNVDGFTPAGFSLMQKMQELDMILDLSHLSEIAVDDALGFYEGPIIASHCNAKSICDSPRNLTDAQIKEIANRGGVIGLVMYDSFITKAHKPDFNDLIRHAEHIAELTGDCHSIAIGSDIDGGFGLEKTPKEINKYSDIARLESFMARANFTSDQIDKIMYRNWRDFLKKYLPY